MLLKFLKYYLYNAVGGNAGSSISSSALKSYTGTGLTGTYSVDVTHGIGGTSSYVSPCKIVVGSGTTPVTETDYKLSSELSGVVQNTSVNYDNRSYFNCVSVLKNSTDSDITINEVGLTRGFDTSSSSITTVLIVREVLETPLVLAPGETKTVTISFNLC